MPTAAPVESPACASVFIAAGALLKMSPTEFRSWERSETSEGSPWRSPLARSASVCGLTTFCSLTFALIMSTVAL